MYSLHVFPTETEMIAFTLDGINDRIDLFEFVTANKVYEYHDKKSLPTGK